MKLNKIVDNQKKYFNSNITKDVKYRISQLKKLKTVLKNNEKQIYDALYSDLRKSTYESYATELSIIYSEINLAIKNIYDWAKPKTVKTNLLNFPGKSIIYSEPIGNVLIISAWNYPFQLSFVPLVSNIAAGNTTILKPSEIAVQSSNVIAEILNSNFNPDFLKVIEGGIDISTELLKIKFDKIFFTGSTQTGKIVYEAAAKNLTPVILELGGKSPAIVFSDADLKIAAKRIAWGKFINAGQTCIAPDYVLVEENIKDKFLEELKKQIPKIVTENSYSKIINKKRFDTLNNLINKKKIYFGGNLDLKNLIIAPTILHNITFNDKIMREEIFGPLLPVITFNKIDEIISKIKKLGKPLSLYIFTKNKEIENKILNEISFGGGAINDTLMHVANSNLPFGGIGASGISSYHGKNGFKNLSHFKSIVKKSTWFDPFLKYPPYTKFKLWILKRVIE